MPVTDHKLAVGVSLIAGLVSIALCGACIGLMHTYSDRRLVLTTLDVFHNWAALKRVYENITQYNPIFNPPTLSHVRFDPWGTTLGQYEDMRNRGLITREQYDNVSASFASVDLAAFSVTHPSLLYRLLSAAECTVPNALPHTTPASRSPGCQCIAGTYLAFVNETANSSSRVSAEVRSKYAGNVLGCVDRRVTRKTTTCETFCSVHPIALALYSNTVLFLSCLAFLLFSEINFNAKAGTLQLLICLAGVLGMLPFILMGGSSNLITIVGLGLVILNLVHAAREDLEDALRGAYTPLTGCHPHPLVVCVCVNLHVIIPAFMVAVGVGGFARDLYAISSFGFAGFLLGVALQCYLWDCWYSPAGVRDFKLPWLSLICAVFFASFFWLYFAYSDPDGVFLVSGATGMGMLSIAIAGIMISVLYVDEQKTAHHRFGPAECSLCLLVLLGNLVLTILTIVDIAVE